jgi:hypothetical protein
MNGSMVQIITKFDNECIEYDICHRFKKAMFGFIECRDGIIIEESTGSKYGDNIFTNGE